MNEEPLVFLSYASQDRERVLPFYDHLKSSGLNVWMDKHSLIGGQNWDVEIKKALQRATIIVTFLSEKSVNKRGYVQRELKIALDQAETKLEDDIYLIPLLLDEGVTIPEQLAHIHAISGSPEDRLRALRDSIYAQLDRLSSVPRVTDEAQPIQWTTRNYEEAWEGLPGYSTTLQFIELRSQKYNNISEVNDLVGGWLVGALHSERKVKFSQMPELFSFGQDRFVRTNSWNASFSEPVITGATLSILYSVWWYGAGAAHPNHHFESFCFSLDPLIRIESLQDIFEQPELGLRALQQYIRDHFLSKKCPTTEAEFTKDWVESGTEDWASFSAFSFTKNGIEVFFAPYQIASYADGTHSVVVPYVELLDFMDKTFQHLLGIAYLKSSVEWEARLATEKAVTE